MRASDETSCGCGPISILRIQARIDLVVREKVQNMPLARLRKDRNQNYVLGLVLSGKPS